MHVRYREIGWLGFLLFSGLSTIPRRVTLGDVLMRAFAAVYMWLCAAHFRPAAAQYQGHWIARAVVAGAACTLTSCCPLRGPDAMPVLERMASPE